MDAEEQVDLWVAGESKCPNDNGECCPDFSCCTPSLLAPLETREAFKKASRGDREAFLFGFLGAAVKEITDQKVYIAGDPTNYEEPS